MPLGFTPTAKDAIAGAVQAVKTASKAHKSFAMLSGVTAAGAVASAVLAMFGTPELAIFGVAFVIAFTFVLLVLVAGERTTNRSRAILVETLTWLFSLMMVLGIGAIGISFFKCEPAPLGSHCKTPLIQRVSLDAFKLLEESNMILNGRDWILQKAVPKSYDQVAYRPDQPTQVAFPLVSTVSNYGHKSDGTIELLLTLLAGTDPKQNN
jgi:hypothetical protein